MEGSDITIRVGLKVELWAQIQAYSLYGKSSHLLYIWEVMADWKITHNRKINLRTYFCPSFSLSRSSAFFVKGSFDPRGPRGGRTNLGQPIAAVCPDGFYPGHVGFWVQKDLAGYLAYRASDEAPPVTCLAYRARRRRYMWHVRVRTWSPISSLSNTSLFYGNKNAWKNDYVCKCLCKLRFRLGMDIEYNLLHKWYN